MSENTEFDLGSLTWVKIEIDQALARARQSLDSYAEKNAVGELKFCQTHLHQALGAIEMVGLNGAARLAEEMEVCVVALAKGGIANSRAMVTAIHESDQRLRQFLEALINGAPNIPLKLYPVYKQLRSLRGEKQISAADLFFPVLSVPLPPTLAPLPLDDATRAKALKASRNRFEGGLLKWMKNAKQEGSQWMMRAMINMARIHNAALQRGFWWAAAACCEGLADNSAKLDLPPQQILTRLNTQLKRVAEGHHQIGERLFRDVLYVVALLNSKSAHCVGVKKAFDLNALMIKAGDADDAKIIADKQLARELKEIINQTKDHWSRFCAGSSERFSDFSTQIGHLAKRGKALGLSGYEQLIAAIQQTAKPLANKPNEALALEIATALLLIENAILVFPEKSADFPKQASTMINRLKSGGGAADKTMLLDEVSRRAQERLLFAQVSQELQSNLRQIEQLLDNYFRDPSTKAELAQLDAPLRQIQGALSILGEQQTSTLVKASQQLIAKCRSGTPTTQEQELLAEILSSLGFYVDALQRDDVFRESIIAPILKKITGKGALPLKDTTVPDASLAKERKAPKVSKPAAPRAPPSSANDSVVDTELLEIYLEEASEVLDNINSHLHLLRKQPSDREALIVVRRSFHTLKGSGRMVGLNQLGEVAWAIEQVMNKWMQDEKNATPELLKLVELAQNKFGVWIKALKAHGKTAVEASDIFSLAGRLKQ